MSRLNLLVQDIMSQKFLDSDISRLLVISFMYRNNCFCKYYKKSDIKEYLYQVYIDNKAAANANPSYVVKNISCFGVRDLSQLLEKVLLDWSEYSVNSVITNDNYFVYLNLDDDDLVNAVPVVRAIIENFKTKYFSFSVCEPFSLNAKDCDKDDDLDAFGNSYFKNRVLEHMQYCQVCEKTHVSELRAVHILPSKYCSDLEKVDKNNGIIFCEHHAKDYLDGKFFFSGSGFLVPNCEEYNGISAHLSINVKNPERRKYLERYEIMNTNNKLL